jgi:hypothetical protein
MLLFGVIAAALIFSWLSNRQYNRMVDRRNKMAEKQEELLEMLRNKNKEKDEN